MDLIRDVLDKQVCDREGRKMGKVDGIILEERPGAPLRVSFLELGGARWRDASIPACTRWCRDWHEPSG